MSKRKWFRRSRKMYHRRTARPKNRFAGFERLEDRRLLAVITVTGLADDTLLNLAGDDQISLREAIVAANTDTSIDGSTAGSGVDTIEFAADLSGPILLADGELVITEGLSINGLGDNVLTIDAQQNSRIFNIDDGGVANDFDVTIAGLTLTGGRTIGDNELGETHPFSGGAIISFTSGNLTIDQSTISGNSTAGNGAWGGGVFSDGELTLTNSTVSGNSTAGFLAAGGGVSAWSSITITNSTISGNSTAGEDAVGGGVATSSGGSVTLTDSTVSGNSTAGNEGGGGVFSDGELTLTDSTVSGNSTAGFGANGGGVYALNVTITNSTISGNSTAGEFANGGGVYASDATSVITVTNSTVTNNHANHASATGGGIYSSALLGFPGVTNITNSIVAENTAGGGNDLEIDSPPSVSLLNVEYSLIGDADGLDIGGTGNIVGDSTGGGIVDPLLGPLADNGGPTETHELLPASPALDAGDPAFEVPPEFDQRGAPFERFVGTAIDMGAFELDTIPPTLTVPGTQTLLEDTPSESLAITVEDDGTANLDDILVTASSSNQTLIPDGNLTLGGSGANRTLVILPAANQNGPVVITITATDPAGNISSEDFDVDVTPVNDAPSFVKGLDQSVPEDAGPQAVDGWATELSAGPADEAGQVLSFQIVGNTNPDLFSAGPVVDSSGNLTYTPAADLNGSAEITIELMDDGGTDNGGVDTSPPETFTITILSVEEQIDNMLDDVQDLVEGGSLNGGQGNALSSKLQNAIDKLNQGKITPGVNILQAYINQVNAFINSGVLTAAEGQPLIDAANAAIASALPGLRADEAFVGNGTVAAAITTDDVQFVFDDAIKSWQDRGVDIHRLDSINVYVANLPDTYLGVASSEAIWINVDAAGFGWSLTSDARLSGRMDLFSVVTHELGHVLGYDHDLMGETLAAGVRQVDWMAHQEDAFPTAVLDSWAGYVQPQLNSIAAPIVGVRFDERNPLARVDSWYRHEDDNLLPDQDELRLDRAVYPREFVDSIFQSPVRQRQPLDAETQFDTSDLDTIFSQYDAEGSWTDL